MKTIFRNTQGSIKIVIVASYIHALRALISDFFFSITLILNHFFFLFHTVSRNLWTDHVLGWWSHKDDPNVLFLKYEDLKKVCWGDVDF